MYTCQQAFLKLYDAHSCADISSLFNFWKLLLALILLRSLRFLRYQYVRAKITRPSCPCHKCQSRASRAPQWCPRVGAERLSVWLSWQSTRNGQVHVFALRERRGWQGTRTEEPPEEEAKRILHGRRNVQEVEEENIEEFQEAVQAVLRIGSKRQVAVCKQAACLQKAWGWHSSPDGTSAKVELLGAAEAEMYKKTLDVSVHILPSWLSSVHGVYDRKTKNLRVGEEARQVFFELEGKLEVDGVCVQSSHWLHVSMPRPTIDSTSQKRQRARLQVEHDFSSQTKLVGLVRGCGRNDCTRLQVNFSCVAHFRMKVVSFMSLR